MLVIIRRHTDIAGLDWSNVVYMAPTSSCLALSFMKVLKPLPFRSRGSLPKLSRHSYFLKTWPLNSQCSSAFCAHRLELAITSVSPFSIFCRKQNECMQSCWLMFNLCAYVNEHVCVCKGVIMTLKL